MNDLLKILKEGMSGIDSDEKCPSPKQRGLLSQ